jgi:hypothetical protein
VSARTITTSSARPGNTSTVVETIPRINVNPKWVQALLLSSQHTKAALHLSMDTTTALSGSTAPGKLITNCMGMGWAFPLGSQPALQRYH